MAGALWFVLSGSGAVVLLALAALWMCARPRSRGARRVLLVLAVFYLVTSVYGISYAVGRVMVAGYRPFTSDDLPSGRAAIVLLGSGSYTARDWNDHTYSMVDSIAATRVLEAARVFRLRTVDWVISSGGKVNPSDRHAPTGETMRGALIDLGVPVDRIKLETQSRNTHQEAVIVAPMLRDLKVDHVVLVTSAIHMRRSIAAFRAVGIEAIPAIARDPFEPDSWLGWVLPSDAGIWNASLTAHEAIGLAYYTARGWTRF